MTWKIRNNFLMIYQYIINKGIMIKAVFQFNPFPHIIRVFFYFQILWWMISRICLINSGGEIMGGQAVG